MAQLERRDFKYLQDLLLREAAIVLHPDKEYLVTSRLNALARVEAKPAADIVMAARGGDRRLQRTLIEAMTTNETSFFRDPSVFADMVTRVIEPILKRYPSGAVRVWCGATSTGQEPYSLAIALDERFPDDAARVQLLASDLDTQALARAREGHFTKLEAGRGLSIARRQRYFLKEDEGFRVHPRIAKRIEFRTQNLSRPFDALGQKHLILLRNVLIYFNRETKTEILRRAGRLLLPGGRLVMGSTETARGLDTGLAAEQVGRCVAYMRES